MTRGQNFIAGEWATATGEEFSSHNPATGEIVWQGNASTAADVDQVVAAARRALPNWIETPMEQRRFILERFQQSVTDRKDEIATIISREVGKPLWEARTEVHAMFGKVPVSLSALETRRSPEAIELDDHTQATRYKPHGVLAVFGPFNFPGHISNGHIVPALLAGNAVVFKPSELTPWVAEWMTQVWHDCGLPAGVLSLVQGGRETGVSLVEHRGVNGVFFTGSLKAGLSISRALAERPETLLALELGGNNPLIVHDVADVDAAVYATIQSSYLTSGQRCTCARRLIVPRGNEDFINRLIQVVPQLRVGAPQDESNPPFMGSLIHSGAVDRVLMEQQRLADSGGCVLVAAERQPIGDAFVSPGLVDVTEAERGVDEEVFGPLLQLIRVSDFSAAIQTANETQYGLVAGLFSQSRTNFDTFFREVNAGLINWNRPTTGASGKLPFGGVGRSGNHRPAGYFMIDACNVAVACLESEQLSLPEKLLPGVFLS
jgi:succinylglutamic semialdehyde dehydrogenase